MDELFVPDGSYLMCNKGDKITQLTVTHHNNTTVYNENLASEADMVPGENIQPFGKCNINNKPCAFDPLYWDKTREHYKVNGYKLLVESACLICKKGGEISISLTLPASGSLITPMQALVGADEGLMMGALNAAGGLKDAAALAPEVRINPQGLANTTLKGNYGEIRSIQELMAKGYDITSTSHATTVQGGGHQGMDYSAKGGSIDIVGDSKYSSTGAKPSMSNTSNSGRQMSDRWLTSPIDPSQPGPSRIQAGMGSADDAARVTSKIANGSDDLKRVANSVDPQGNVKWYDVDNTGKVGSQIDLPPANVMSGSGRASNFINNVSNSIQSTKGVSSANKWLIQNADHVARWGKSVGRGALVVGIVMDGISIYQGFQADGGKIGVNTTTAAGSAVGGMAGGFAGAKIGAAIGAVGGPVGVLVGGVVGGVVGGIIGSGVGSKIGAFFGSLF